MQGKVTGDHDVYSRNQISHLCLAPLEGGQSPPVYQGGHHLSILGTVKKMQLPLAMPRSWHKEQPPSAVWQEHSVPQ